MKNYKKELWFFFIVFFFTFPGTFAISETIHVNAQTGSDENPGTKQQPLKTLEKAAKIVNDRTDAGPTTIKLAPGVYNITKCVVFENTRRYTEKDRLTIEATILPDDPNWNPILMPVILSTEDPRKAEELDKRTETYSLKIKISHVTIRGLKFLGNPLSNNWHCCVERVGEKPNDLLITQCMFLGDKDTLNIYCPVIANGDGFVVEHCIFQKCNASVVFWDGPEAIGGRRCAMKYCIVDGGYISGVWTCQTAEDFEFHHNIVTDCEYFWMRKPGDKQKYKLHDCIVTGNKFYSGYGIASGPTGSAGEEVVYDETNITKKGKITLVRDKKTRNYLHVLRDTLRSDLGAGLFKKDKEENAK